MLKFDTVNLQTVIWDEEVPIGVVANERDCNIVVGEFELLSSSLSDQYFWERFDWFLGFFV